MKRAARPLAWLAVPVLRPAVDGDLYVLHMLIITGIFIIAAMSLNLLLGYTGPAEPRPRRLLRHRRLRLEPRVAGLRGAPAARLAGARSSPSRSGSACCAASSLAGAVRLGDRQDLLQGARRLFRHRLGELRRGGPAGGAQLGGADAGADGAQQHPGAAARRARLVRAVAFCASPPTTTWCWRSRVLCYVLIRRLVHSRAGRAMIALRENEPLATSVGVDVTQLPRAGDHVSAAMAGAAGALYAHYVRIVDPDVFLFIYTVTMVIMVISRRQGHAGRAHRRRPDLRPAAGGPARGRHQARGAMGGLRRADDPGRLLPARGHRAGRAPLVAGRAARRPRRDRADGRGRADERARRRRARRRGPDASASAA